jgi:peptidyl-prolyl cis-trans isomerase C/peptidyl-prolyl cis-trans isomerase D
MKNSVLFQVLALVMLTAPSAFSSTEVARVNDKVITLEEVNARLVEASRGNPVGAPGKKQILEDLIKREAAVQEAKRMKLDQDPSVQDRLANVLYLSLIEKKLGGEFEKLSPTDAEAKVWYERNPEIRTSHIFIPLAPDANSDEESRASKNLSSIQSDIKAGRMSFAEAAQKFSEDPSAALGGDLDYRLKDRLDPTYFKAALKLGKVGDLSGPVRTPYGMHLIRLTGKHSWSEVDRSRVKRLVGEEKKQELVARYLNELRQRAKISTNEKAI